MSARTRGPSPKLLAIVTAERTGIKLTRRVCDGSTAISCWNSPAVSVPALTARLSHVTTTESRSLRWMRR
jgi:hypothetical protein